MQQRKRNKTDKTAKTRQRSKRNTNIQDNNNTAKQ
jgi:hypothetical protein